MVKISLPNQKYLDSKPKAKFMFHSSMENATFLLEPRVYARLYKQGEYFIYKNMISPSIILNNEKNPKPKPPVGSANQPSKLLPKPNLFHGNNTVNSNFLQWCKSFRCLKMVSQEKSQSA